MLFIKQSYLSMIIQGSRKANRETILKLRSAGFDTDVFHHYLSISPLPSAEKLTIQEIEFVVRGLKELISQKDIIIESMEWEIKNYRNEITELRSKIHKFTKPVNLQECEFI